MVGAHRYRRVVTAAGTEALQDSLAAACCADAATSHKGGRFLSHRMGAIEGGGTARHPEVEVTTQGNAYTMKNVVQTAARAQKPHAGCSKRRRTFSHAAQSTA